MILKAMASSRPELQLLHACVCLRVVMATHHQPEDVGQPTSAGAQAGDWNFQIKRLQGHTSFEASRRPLLAFSSCWSPQMFLGLQMLTGGLCLFLGG